MDRNGMGRLLAYTEWANHRVVRAAATLGVDDFKRDLKSSHGGVRGTLSHMLFAEWLWLERWKGLASSYKMDEGEFPDIKALSERWRVCNEHRQAWFKALPEGAPSAVIHYRNMAGQPYQSPLAPLVQHVANHASYHRGQAITLLRQLGAAVVATDLVVFDRELPEAATGQGYGRGEPERAAPDP